LKNILLGCLCLLIAILSVPASAKELRVGLAELDYPPFYFETNGEYHGAALDISMAVAKKLGHELVFVRAPWGRIQAYLRSGSIDMMILYFKTKERARDVIYTKIPHINESSDLFILSNEDIEFEGQLNDLVAYKFGYVRGYSHGAEFDNAKHLSKHSFANEEQLIKGLANGRIDIGVGNKQTIIKHTVLLKLNQKIRFLSPSLHVGKNYIAFSKTRKDAQELEDEFSSQLKVFMKSDKYRTILKKYNFDSY